MKRRNISTLAGAVSLFYGVMFLVLMLVTYVPAISLWLSRLLSL
jgi:TRAP-type C4-dicarboxylate transport system permease large subunit